MTRRAARVTLAKNAGEFSRIKGKSSIIDEDDIPDDEWQRRVNAVRELRSSLMKQQWEIGCQINGVERALELMDETIDE